jgi:protein TonB
MKTFYTLLFAVLCHAFAAAQTPADTVYYDKSWKKSDVSDYTYYRIITHTDTLLAVKDYYRTGELQMSGTYKTSIPLEVKNGHFMYFHKNGIKTKDCYYKDGILNGKCLTYDSTGQIKKEVNYTKGFPDDLNQADTITHYIKREIKDGIITTKESIYKNGKWTTTESTKKQDPLSTFYKYDPNTPMFPGGYDTMFQFIHTHLKYPESALKKHIEGKVEIQYSIKEDGSITDIKVYKSSDTLFNEAAINVIKQFPKFKMPSQTKVSNNISNCTILFKLPSEQK